MKADLFVIGGGPGGYEAALEAAAMGKSVALAEESLVGGTCLNRGCIPTKALLRAARLYAEMRKDAEELGIHVTGTEEDLPAMLRRAAAVKDQLRSGVEERLRRAKVLLIPARARVTAPGEIETADGARYEAEQILLATGSSPAPLPLPGADLPGVYFSDALLEGEGVDCRRLIIIGGGVIGAELAQVYSDLGREVVILEAMPRLLPKMDRELGQSLAQSFKKRGIEIHTGAMLKSIAREGEELVFSCEEKGQPLTIRGDAALLCVGRRPNTKDLMPPEMAEIMERGFIRADEKGKTALPGLWAIGDVRLGSPQLAHAATAEGLRAVHAMFGNPSDEKEAPVPFCVFTNPEIASVGLTQEEAKERGIPITTVKNLTSANGRAMVEGAERGFAKLVFSAEGQLLGAQLLCPHAAEMAGALGALIHTGATREQLAAVIWPHPTVSEILSVR